MVTPLNIAGRLVGHGQPCLIIAEAGVNHNGSLRTALDLVAEARAAGVDAVKFQTFQANKLVTPNAPKAEYQKKLANDCQSQLKMLQSLELTAEEFRVLSQACTEQGLIFLSTPFGRQSADLLEKLGMAAFKISSGEVTNLPLLEHIANKRKPVILSTGMSSMDELEEAVACLKQHGCQELVLLQCTSCYPADPADANLRAMSTMAKSLGVAVGYSDHTLGDEVALAAVALGACIIEKHLTLSRSMPGPDHRASVEPNEFASLVKSIRTVECALGDGVKKPVSSEINVAKVARRSIVAARDLTAGQTLDASMLAMRRPGLGMPPSELKYLMGRRLSRDVKCGELMNTDMIL